MKPSWAVSKLTLGYKGLKFASAKFSNTFYTGIFACLLRNYIGTARLFTADGCARKTRSPLALVVGGLLYDDPITATSAKDFRGVHLFRFGRWNNKGAGRGRAGNVSVFIHAVP